MRLVSLLFTVHPDRLHEVRSRLASMPGVTVHSEPVPSKLAVTIEDCPELSADAVMPTVLDIQSWPGVLASTLTYEFDDSTGAAA